MSASYHETLDRDLDWVRKDIGDTDVNDDEEAALVTDEHILAVIAAKGAALATAEIAEGLVTRFAQEPVRVSLTGLSVDYSERVPVWQALASRMRAAVAAAADTIAQGAYASGDAETQGVW